MNTKPKPLSDQSNGEKTTKEEQHVWINITVSRITDTLKNTKANDQCVNVVVNFLVVIFLHIENQKHMDKLNTYNLK